MLCDASGQCRRADDTPADVRRVLVGAIVCILAAAGFASCRGGTSSSSLPSLPEARLFYPHSVVIGRYGHGDVNGPDGPARASEGWLLGTAADRASVEGFYDDQLRQRGWQPDTTDVFQGTGETDVLGWRRGALVFRFAIRLKSDVRAPRAADAYTTAYRIDLWRAG